MRVANAAFTTTLIWAAALLLCEVPASLGQSTPPTETTSAPSSQATAGSGTNGDSASTNGSAATAPQKKTYAIPAGTKVLFATS